MSKYQDWKESLVEGKNQCYKCASKGQDNSRDNFHFYGEGLGGFCHACSHTIPSDEWLLENGEEREEFEEEIIRVGIAFTEEDHDKLKKITSFNPKGYRGLTEETCKYFGVRHEFSQETGEVVKQYYPNTTADKFDGYKERIIFPKKDFRAYGNWSNDSDLFGQWRFKDARGKFVLICAGELDQLSGFQMLEDYRKSRNSDFDPIPVVSPINGEGGAFKQLQNQYQYLDRFEKIILCFDNDEAGGKALEKAVKVMPKGKVYVMRLTLNDTNEYLMGGKEKQWVNAFYKAEKYAPHGITSSLNLEDKMLEYISMPKITLPPFMYKLQKMLAGGIPLGYIVNILSASGTGKSTFVDAMIKHWIMKVDYLVGIVSLEASEGEYGVNLSSSYCGLKLNLIETVEDKIKYLQKPENVAKRNELWQKENGDPRFYLVDAEIDTMQQKIEYLVRALDCKIIVLDPLQDIMDMLDADAQAKWMVWEKDLVKKEKVTIININHSRKSGQGQKANSRGADLSEEDIMGSSTIFKSGAINIVLTRDKENEDDIERNTTYAKITKARGVGKTGPAGSYYYDIDTHTIHDKEWWEDNIQGKKPIGLESY